MEKYINILAIWWTANRARIQDHWNSSPELISSSHSCQAITLVTDLSCVSGQSSTYHSPTYLKKAAPRTKAQLTSSHLTRCWKSDSYWAWSHAWHYHRGCQKRDNSCLNSKFTCKLLLLSAHLLVFFRQICSFTLNTKRKENKSLSEHIYRERAK